MTEAKNAARVIRRQSLNPKAPASQATCAPSNRTALQAASRLLVSALERARRAHEGTDDEHECPCKGRGQTRRSELYKTSNKSDKLGDNLRVRGAARERYDAAAV